MYIMQLEWIKFWYLYFWQYVISKMDEENLFTDLDRTLLSL